MDQKKTIFFLGGAIMVLMAVFLGSGSALAADSDVDGYSDEIEIAAGYSPYNPAPVKLTDNDADSDGLNDYWELAFGADPMNPDTDGDGHPDGREIDQAFDPLSTSTKKLAQRIEIDLKTQKLAYYVKDQKWRESPVSTGKASMPTPKGSFKIINKNVKAWSKSYGLYMPYWLGLNRGEFGIHELPVWPNGYREGADHLGRPVSHGCIRLGIGPAQYIYERVATGTVVIIK